MDEICVLGMGLIGLLFIASQNKTEKLLSNKPSESENLNVLEPIDNKEEIAQEFLNSMFLSKDENKATWSIPDNQLDEFGLYPFLGLSYIQFEMNEPVIIGRYMKIDNVEKCKYFMPNITVDENPVVHNGEEYYLVKNKSISIGESAITLHFIENINNDLTVCEMKRKYKKMLGNYRNKNIIEPTIEWYHPEVFDEPSNLHETLLGSETSELLTNQVVETELDTYTSLEEAAASLEEEIEPLKKEQVLSEVDEPALLEEDVVTEEEKEDLQNKHEAKRKNENYIKFIYAKC